MAMAMERMERGSHQYYIKRLEDIEEEKEEGNLMSLSLPHPETPIETMEFLARSWSLSALELSKALGEMAAPTMLEKTSSADSMEVEHQEEHSSPQAISLPENSTTSQSRKPVPQSAISPPVSPTNHGDLKGFRGTPRVKTMAGWLKDQKEKRKVEARTHSAEVYAATSVAGVAAAVAAIAAQSRSASKTSAAVASAAALVASHCVEMAHAMGAGHDHVLAVVHSAVNAQTSGDIMALTAGAATALRGAATLRARLHKEILTSAQAQLIGEIKDSERWSTAITFVSQGGELLKRTRKGVLHWKQVSFYINSSWQVVIKMKSTHIAGTFVKKKKSVVIAISSDTPAWTGRDVGEGADERAHFAVKTPERLIEFECKSSNDKPIWIEGIRQMLNCRAQLNEKLLCHCE